VPCGRSRISRPRTVSALGYAAFAPAYALFLAADVAVAVLDAVGLSRLALRDALLRAQSQRELARVPRRRRQPERCERHTQG